MASLGHPIVADSRYNPYKARISGSLPWVEMEGIKLTDVLDILIMNPLLVDRSGEGSHGYPMKWGLELRIE
jgi:hypothetical protein